MDASAGRGQMLAFLGSERVHAFGGWGVLPRPLLCRLPWRGDLLQPSSPSTPLAPRPLVPSSGFCSWGPLTWQPAFLAEERSYWQEGPGKCASVVSTCQGDSFSLLWCEGLVTRPQQKKGKEEEKRGGKRTKRDKIIKSNHFRALDMLTPSYRSFLILSSIWFSGLCPFHSNHCQVIRYLKLN